MHASTEPTVLSRTSPSRRAALAAACLLAVACAPDADTDETREPPRTTVAAQVEPQVEPGASEQAATRVDASKNGPRPSTTIARTGPNGGYTVYLPGDLATRDEKAPILAWMSGGGTIHSLYPLLPRLATHGFVVVAADVIPGIGTEVDLGKQQLAGIDWAIGENTRTGSPLEGKLDTTKIAAFGYSMGSLATFTIAGDPRITTTVHLSGGNFAPERVRNLRAPAAFLCGAPNPTCNILAPNCDIAAVNCDRDFQNATTPVFYANHAGGHLAVLADPHASRINALTVEWLRWKLYGEEARRAVFVGGDCAACKDSFWKVKQKNLD
ncbi:MAG: hypothetical protein ABW252_17095 [Polyangiales bacterium]